MEAAFQAQQEAAEERWRAERDDIQAKFDQALTFMQSLGSAMGSFASTIPSAPTCSLGRNSSYRKWLWLLLSFIRLSDLELI